MVVVSVHDHAQFVGQADVGLRDLPVLHLDLPSPVDVREQSLLGLGVLMDLIDRGLP